MVTKAIKGFHGVESSRMLTPRFLETKCPDYSQRLTSALSLLLLISLLFVSAPASGQYQSWKMFSNRAGWSIRYPADWTIASCKSCTDPKAPEVFVNFLPPSKAGSGSVKIEHLADRSSGMSVDAWFADIRQKANPNPRLSEERFTLNDLPALKVRYRNPSGGGSETETVYVVSDTQTFAVEFSGEGPGVSLADSPGNYLTYLEMVKSFRIKR